jgi:hypothetical protein
MFEAGLVANPAPEIVTAVPGEPTFGLILVIVGDCALTDVETISAAAKTICQGIFMREPLENR